MPPEKQKTPLQPQSSIIPPHFRRSDHHVQRLCSSARAWALKLVYGESGVKKEEHAEKERKEEEKKPSKQSDVPAKEEEGQEKASKQIVKGGESKEDGHKKAS